MIDTYEIEKHELVPKHSLLNKEEAEILLTKYNVNKNQLPKISRKDPAVKSLNAKHDDIIIIERKSGTAGKSIYYRVVYD